MSANYLASDTARVCKGHEERGPCFGQVRKTVPNQNCVEEASQPRSGSSITRLDMDIARSTPNQ